MEQQNTPLNSDIPSQTPSQASQPPVVPAQPQASMPATEAVPLQAAAQPIAQMAPQPMAQPQAPVYAPQQQAPVQQQYAAQPPMQAQPQYAPQQVGQPQAPVQHPQGYAPVQPQAYPPVQQAPIQPQGYAPVQPQPYAGGAYMPSQMGPSRIPQGMLSSLLDDNGGPIYPPADEKFNWGAFLLNFIHAICHRQFKIAGVLFGVQMVILLINIFLPFLVILVAPVNLAVCYMYGKIGYRAACLGKHYTSANELYERERKYLWIGLGLILINVLITVGVIIYAVHAFNQLASGSF